MSKTILIIITVVAVIALAALAYAFFKEPEQASAPIEAVPVLVETESPLAAATTPVSEPTKAPTLAPTDAPTLAAESTPEPTTAPIEAQPTATQVVTVETTPQVFEIVQAESEARFIINEVLRGSPKTVVGATDQVAGQILIDPANPGAAQMGPILVNARTLATDSDMRNRAVKNRILQTDAYEFVTFTPTELIGLPESAAVGQSFSFQIAGDLTIRDKTLPVIFEATVTPVSETRLEGLASTTLRYADFGLIIPDAPAVNSVEDDVTLELQFVATVQ